MAQPPLLSLNDVRLTFGGNPLFTGVSFSLSKGERVALVGRNGAGKSTLMKIISESLEADSGEVWRQPGITYASLPRNRALPVSRPCWTMLHKVWKPAIWPKRN